MPAIRTFAVVAAVAIALFHLLPEAISAAGWMVLIATAIGAFGPAALERMIPSERAHTHDAPTTALAMGYAAVIAHQAGEVCLADSHGNVVVVSTRDCSLQRRHQKLVEEAPAPFLSTEQMERLYCSSKAILAEAGYVGAGTCEFLVGQDGTISFLEVNTRLQVEHPVSEQVTGLDLVREMFRIAEGEPLGYDDPVVTGHSIEFRINAEDRGPELPACARNPDDVATALGARRSSR